LFAGRKGRGNGIWKHGMDFERHYCHGKCMAISIGMGMKIGKWYIRVRRCPY
jgi:hypothetical protein